MVVVGDLDRPVDRQTDRRPTCHPASLPARFLHRSSQRQPLQLHITSEVFEHNNNFSEWVTDWLTAGQTDLHIYARQFRGFSRKAENQGEGEGERNPDFTSLFFDIVFFRPA